MSYFENCSTAEQLKNIFKNLSKTHHPDRGGSNETMSLINAEYRKVLARINKKKIAQGCTDVLVLPKRKSTLPAVIEESPLMKIKKDFLGLVMRKAWQIFNDNKAFKVVDVNHQTMIVKNYKPKFYTFKKSMQMAWAEMKKNQKTGKFIKTQQTLF
jgi:hypothetical protein